VTGIYDVIVVGRGSAGGPAQRKLLIPTRPRTMPEAIVL